MQHAWAACPPYPAHRGARDAGPLQVLGILLQATKSICLQGEPAFARFADGYLSIISVLTGHGWAALGMGLGYRVFISMRPPGEQSGCGAHGCWQGDPEQCALCVPVWAGRRSTLQPANYC